MADLSNEPPASSPIAQLYVEGLHAGKLQFQRCRACGADCHPPTAMCPACASADHEIIVSTGRGRIASWIIPRRPALPAPAAIGRTVVLVTLDEGIEVLGHYMGASEPAFDERVHANIALFAGRPIPVFEKLADAKA